MSPGTGDSSSDPTEGGETQNPLLSPKDAEDTKTRAIPGHQELKEKEEMKSPVSEVQQPNLESARNRHQLDESRNSRQSQEVKRQESLLSQGSTASTSHRREAKDKVGANGSSHPTLRSRQLQIRKERINFDSAPTSRQLQSKDKTEPNSTKPVPQARKLSRQEDQQTTMDLESSIRRNGQPKVMKGATSGAGAGNTTRQPISEPKQLQRREEFQSNPDLTSSIPALSMSRNYVMLKERANSTGTMIDNDSEYADPRDARKPSDTSGGRISPKVTRLNGFNIKCLLSNII